MRAFVFLLKLEGGTYEQDFFRPFDLGEAVGQYQDGLNPGVLLSIFVGLFEHDSYMIICGFLCDANVQFLCDSHVIST